MRQRSITVSPLAWKDVKRFHDLEVELRFGNHGWKRARSREKIAAYWNRDLLSGRENVKVA